MRAERILKRSVVHKLVYLQLYKYAVCAASSFQTLMTSAIELAS